jgi:CubicO group peptidase (beta-lactamase class C family)
MHDDDLKRLWQEQRFDAPPALADEQQLAAMKRKMKGFGRSIFWRDCRESIAAVFIIIYFGWQFFVVSSLLPKLGCVILVLSSVFICWYPLRQKRRVAAAAPDATMTEALECELKKIEVEIGLLRSIFWWYLLPLGVGVLVFYLGIRLSLASSVADLLASSAGYVVFVLALYAFIYWLNQRAVDKCLLPLKRELEASLNLAESTPSIELKKKSLMSPMILLGIGLIVLGALVLVRAVNSKPTPSLTYADPQSQMLESLRVKHKFPALAAAVVVDGRIVATNGVGFRKHGADAQVSAEDKFHIGSVTKSMTATAAAMLVEAGRISWTNTIADSFPELREALHADYRSVTLEQLLSHRGGAPGSPPRALWAQAWQAKGTAAEQRLAFARGILERAPEAKPGTKKIYSNAGYSIAGVMLEKAAGKPWEDLLRTMLFEPLGMTTAGFGAPASLGETDQPWGHEWKLLAGLLPVPPGPRADNPWAITPAGAVHCSIGDLAKYAAFHMAGERGQSPLLTPASFKKLHTAVDGDDYALGWIVLSRPWANGRALMHNGSNTMFYVVLWLAPEKNCAVIVATNVGLGDPSAFLGCDEVASKLINQYFPK